MLQPCSFLQHVTVLIRAVLSKMQKKTFDFLQLQLDQALEDMKTQLLESMVHVNKCFVDNCFSLYFMLA